MIYIRKCNCIRRFYFLMKSYESIKSYFLSSSHMSELYFIHAAFFILLGDLMENIFINSMKRLKSRFELCSIEKLKNIKYLCKSSKSF